MISENEVEKAFRIWRRNYDFNEIDIKIGPFLFERIIPFREGEGWLSISRNSLCLTAAEVAEKIGIARITYTKFEESERKGSISISSLAKAASGMDCELVYAIRPKCLKAFSVCIWDEIRPFAMEHPWITKCDPKNRAGALAGIARRKFEDSKFRKKSGWSQRANGLTS